MNSFVIFDSTTGVARLAITLSKGQNINDQLFPGEDFLEGPFYPKLHLIDVSGEKPVVVDKPPPPPPTNEEITDRDERVRLGGHPLLRATPDQIDIWIDENSTKDALKVLAKISILGVRR